MIESSRLSLSGIVLSLSFFFVASAAAQSAAPVTLPAPPDTGYVIYDDGPISLPLGVGLRIPLYDRVDGLALPFGPIITLAKGRVELDPTVTYRSHLGEFDPFAKATIRLRPADALVIAAGRATFSNDDWIRNTLVNSAASFVVGSDARNYFRADRITAQLSHEIVGNGTTLTPRVGVLYENAWSTGTPVPHTSAPWSIFGRTSDLKMRRINPTVASGRTASATAGINFDYDLNQLVATVDAGVERAFSAPGFRSSGRKSGGFTQFTLNAKGSFLTFGTQSFSFRGHALITPGSVATPQRFSYLGGAGTIATVDLLALGGDRVAFVEGEYSVPFSGPLLPFVGAPIASVSYSAGAAGVGTLPNFIQNVGVGLGVKLIKAEFHVDPNYHKTPYTHRTAFSVGVSLSM